MNAVSYSIAKDSQLIQTVEHPGFIAMLKIFDSRSQIPSYKIFFTTIIALNNKRKGDW